MILADWQIRELADQGMIAPFKSELIRERLGHKAISYGLSSYGYDLRLSHRDFRIFHRIPGEIVDPKRFNPQCLSQVSPVITDQDECYFILPAHSYGLGVALERLEMPPSVTGLCIGKSTYARSGVIVNMTPVEAGWRGHLTIEISNSSDSDVRIYAQEGICQVLFFKGDPCETSYDDRTGKYQNQQEIVTLAKG